MTTSEWNELERAALATFEKLPADEQSQLREMAGALVAAVKSARPHANFSFDAALAILAAIGKRLIDIENNQDDHKRRRKAITNRG